MLVIEADIHEYVGMSYVDKNILDPLVHMSYKRVWWILSMKRSRAYLFTMSHPFLVWACSLELFANRRHLNER